MSPQAEAEAKAEMHLAAAAAAAEGGNEAPAFPAPVQAFVGPWIEAREAEMRVKELENEAEAQRLAIEAARGSELKPTSKQDSMTTFTISVMRAVNVVLIAISRAPLKS